MKSELEMEAQEITDKAIEISKDIVKAAYQELHKVLSQVVAKSIEYNVPGEGDESESTKKTVEGRAKMAVCESFIELAMIKMPELFSQQHDLLIGSSAPIAATGSSLPHDESLLIQWYFEAKLFKMEIDILPIEFFSRF